MSIRTSRRRPLVRRIRAAAVPLGLCAAAAALALPEDASQPIHIEAEHAEVDQNAGTVVYTGAVQAQQGTMRVSADRLTVEVEDQKVVRITAEGKPAKYQQIVDEERGLVKADARTIVYHTRQEQVDLKGEAFLEQGGNEISGELIHYDIVAGRVQAESGDDDRVRVIVQPATRESVEP